MTLLSVAQRVCTVVGLDVPDTLASNTNREYVELFDIIQEMALRISRGHNWQSLARTSIITGDGTTESYDLPSDYDRQQVKTQLWSSSLETALTHIPDLDKWLELEVQQFDYVINAWIIFGDQIHLRPALDVGVTAQYFYQSNQIIKAQDGTFKTEFTADEDNFRLDEQLLKLGVIWQWRESKGLSYAEDMQNYEELKSRLVARDKGSRLVRVGNVRLPHDVNVAYPQVIRP